MMGVRSPTPAYVLSTLPAGLRDKLAVTVFQDPFALRVHAVFHAKVDLGNYSLKHDTKVYAECYLEYTTNDTWRIPEATMSVLCLSV